MKLHKCCNHRLTDQFYYRYGFIYPGYHNNNADVQPAGKFLSDKRIYCWFAFGCGNLIRNWLANGCQLFVTLF